MEPGGNARRFRYEPGKRPECKGSIMDGSLTPLTPEQRLLLSAHMDGALDAAENAQAEALLQRADAQAYLKQLRALRVLVAKHGAAQAPENLKSTVLAALNELPQGRVIAMPRATWATAIAALAAMLIVGTALYFAPSMIGPDPQTPQVPLAKGLDNAAPGAIEKLPDAPKPADERSQADAAEAFDRAQPGPDKFAGNDARVLKDNEQEEARGAPREDAVPRPAPAVPGGGSGAPEAAAKKPESDGKAEAKGDRGDEAGATRKALEKAKAEDDKPAGERERDAGRAERRSAQADDDAEKMGGKGREDAAAEVVLSLKTEHGLAAQNDVLRVSAMYGIAKLGELPEEGVEDVLVEVEESRLPALVAALQKLSDQQEYGKLEVPENLARPAAAANSLGGARDVLPEDLRDKIEGKESGPRPAEAAAPARKVRLKVALR